jgi:hypothetical protein
MSFGEWSNLQNSHERLDRIPNKVWPVVGNGLTGSQECFSDLVGFAGFPILLSHTFSALKIAGFRFRFGFGSYDLLPFLPNLATGINTMRAFRKPTRPLYVPFYLGTHPGAKMRDQ